MFPKKQVPSRDYLAKPTSLCSELSAAWDDWDWFKEFFSSITECICGVVRPYCTALWCSKLVKTTQEDQVVYQRNWNWKTSSISFFKVEIWPASCANLQNISVVDWICPTEGDQGHMWTMYLSSEEKNVFFKTEFWEKKLTSEFKLSLKSSCFLKVKKKTVLNSKSEHKIIFHMWP